MSTFATWMDDVVPVAMKVGASQEQTIHLDVRHLDTKGILTRIELGFHREPGRRADAADELRDRLVIDQRATAPVFGDVAEQPMLDLVPLRGPRRKVRHADGESCAVREALQLTFLERGAGAVAAPRIGRDEEFARVGICLLPHVPPPPRNGFDREGRRVVIDTHADPAGVLRQVVHAIRNHLPEHVVQEVEFSEGFTNLHTKG